MELRPGDSELVCHFQTLLPSRTVSVKGKVFCSILREFPHGADHTHGYRPVFWVVAFLG